MQSVALANSTVGEAMSLFVPSPQGGEECALTKSLSSLLGSADISFVCEGSNVLSYPLTNLLIITLSEAD